MMETKQQSTTAILVFANSSSEETRRKKIAKSKPLFDALTANTLRTVKRTDIPFFHITEKEQIGDSFGARFCNAVQFVFDQGYENVITVGNDSPHLSKTHLLDAASQLKQGTSVIGPSADGGFYLMGLHCRDFKKSDFEDLSWQTSRLKGEISSVLFDKGKEIVFLSTLFDIDTIWDVEVICKNASGLAQDVTKAIRSLIASNGKIELPSILSVNGFHSPIHYNKGSPVFLSY